VIKKKSLRGGIWPNFQKFSKNEKNCRKNEKIKKVKLAKNIGKIIYFLNLQMSGFV